MSLHCKVIFARNPLNVFYSGQTVRGYVQLLAAQDDSVSSIRIEIDGIAITKFKQNDTIRVYRKDFFHHHLSVIGNKFNECFIAGLFEYNFIKICSISAEERCLTAKIYRFPFQFKLPSESPVSFEGAYGYIRYKLTAIIESPFRSNDVLTEPITILRAIDATEPDMQVFILFIRI